MISWPFKLPAPSLDTAFSPSKILDASSWVTANCIKPLLSKVIVMASPAFMVTLPTDAVIFPWLITVWPMSATVPPVAALMVPLLIIAPLLDPVKKLYSPARNSSPLISRELATKLLALTVEPWVKLMPLTFTKNNWPLATMLPAIRLAWLSLIKFRTESPVLFILKVTVSPAATSKLFQLMTVMLSAKLVMSLPLATSS